MSEMKQLRPIALMPEAVVQSGFIALFHKEVKRFYKVAFQTVAAPVLTAVLYLLIFVIQLEKKLMKLPKASTEIGKLKKEIENLKVLYL